MHKRLKELRNYLCIGQDELGSKLGVTSSAISRLESGKRNLTEQMILSITRVFNVNENWFRTGDGEMFIHISPEDEFISATDKLARDNDRMAMQVVIEYLKLDENSKKVLRNFLIKIVENFKINE